MLLTRSVVLVAAMLALSACAGGGGGGGGGGPTTPVTPPTPPKAPTPPATPYASNCAATPGALTCSGGSLGTGQFTIQQMQTDQGGLSFDYVSLDNRKTPATDDDLYVFANTSGAGVIYRYYDTPTVKTDGLGRIRTGANYGRDGITGAHLPGDGSTLTLYDISNVLQGGLDYVQLGSLSSAGSTKAPTYFVMGSGLQRPLLPTTGTAKFDGGARGSYTTSAGAVYSTLSDLTLTADFAKASVSGSASNFYVLDSAGAAAFAPKDLNFSFTGAIENNAVYGPRFDGSATGTNATGTVSGAFYGQPGQAPAEVGMNYKLTDTGGGTLVGVGGLKRNP
jgi:hypothetical protein